MKNLSPARYLFTLKVGPAPGEDFCTNGLLARNTASYQTNRKVMLFLEFASR